MRTDEWLMQPTPHPREVGGQRSLALWVCTVKRAGGGREGEIRLRGMSLRRSGEWREREMKQEERGDK